MVLKMNLNILREERSLKVSAHLKFEAFAMI